MYADVKVLSVLFGWQGCTLASSPCVPVDLFLGLKTQHVSYSPADAPWTKLPTSSVLWIPVLGVHAWLKSWVLDSQEIPVAPLYLWWHGLQDQYRAQGRWQHHGWVEDTYMEWHTSNTAMGWADLLPAYYVCLLMYLEVMYWSTWLDWPTQQFFCKI